MCVCMYLLNARRGRGKKQTRRTTPYTPIYILVVCTHVYISSHRTCCTHPKCHVRCTWSYTHVLYGMYIPVWKARYNILYTAMHFCVWFFPLFFVFFSSTRGIRISTSTTLLHKRKLLCPFGVYI